MCGLVGVAATRSVERRAWLADASASLHHRGPDAHGSWWSDDGRVGLAHRRLAIVDRSPAGRQPMRLEQRGLTVVFNGEIYNFRDLRRQLEALGQTFQSGSDTEVLLGAYAAWGEDCLPRLVGMFAFALHDAARGRLLLARDRVGEKPLFFHLADGRLHFASELKALLACPQLPRRLDPEALDCYLAFGHVPSPRCLLAGYSKLPPAHALRFDLDSGAARSWAWWTPPPLEPSARTASPQALLDRLEVLLEQAVADQLLADVPVGILLSGGVDSSLVTALAARRRRVRTFTIGFPGHGALDETSHARLIAGHFGTDHTELVAEPTSADLLPRLARQFDEPMVDSSMLPTWLVSHLVRRHCTVALGGDGGDELFGGYGHYSCLLRQQRWLGPIPRPLRRLVAGGAERWLPLGLRGRQALMGCDLELGHGLPLRSSLFDRTSRRRLLARRPGHPLVAERWRAAAIPRQSDLLQRATRADFISYLAEDILVKVDRASMLESLEMRAPFLDARLLQFAFAEIPSSLKASGDARKILLRRLAQRLLPAGFDVQRKQGFSIPLASWLRQGPYRELFWSVLQEADDGPFDPALLRRLLQGQDHGRSHSERLFALVLFELWRREYGIVG